AALDSAGRPVLGARPAGPGRCLVPRLGGGVRRPRARPLARDVMTLAHLLEGQSDAPVLVLPSSLGTTRELWDPQLDAFEREFRVLRYEHRGHGASPAPPGPYSMAELGADAIELLDELGIERAVWCGLSLGGMVGMWLAVHAPERLSGLVLACTSAHVASPDVYRERAALVRERGIEPVAGAIVARWFTVTTFAERP